jgi:DnaJ-class molecular chaperone
MEKTSPSSIHGAAALFLLALPFLSACVVYDKDGNVDPGATREVNESLRAGFEASAQALSAGAEAWQAYEVARRCGYCQGSGVVVCGYCQGHGRVRCNYCGGSGHLFGAWCGACRAYGAFQCPRCGGAGRFQCHHGR